MPEDEKSLALEIHLKEYDVLRREIELHLSQQQTLTNYSLILIGGTAVFYSSSLTSLQELPYLFLIPAILISSVNLAIMDLGIGIQDIAHYTYSSLIKKIRRLLENQDNLDFKVLDWEYWINENRTNPPTRGITAIAKYFIGWFFSSLLTLSFFYYRGFQKLPLTLHEWALALLSLALLLGLPGLAVFNHSVFSKRFQESKDEPQLGN